MKEKIASVLAIIILLTTAAFTSAKDLPGNQAKGSSIEEQSGSLLQLLDKQTILLLREAFKSSDMIVEFLLDSEDNYISPDLPTPGTFIQNKKENLLLGKENVGIIVSETSAFPEGEKYTSTTVWGTDLGSGSTYISMSIDISEKLIAVMPYYEGKFEFTGTKVKKSFDVEESYIASKGEIKTDSPSIEVVRIYDRKYINEGVDVVSIPEAILKPGIYSAFNGTDSAFILNNDGSLAAVLVGSGDNCDLYIPTEAEVTGELIQSQKEAILPNGGKVIFPEVSLRPGAYRAVNGLDCAFIFDNKNDVIAILSKDNDMLNLHVACTAEVTESPLDSPLKPGTYKAFNGLDYAIILDADGNPVDVNLRATQPQACLKGDVNGDGKILSNDAILALKIAAGILVPDNYQKCAADVNCDGEIKSNDATLILRKSAGLPASICD